MIPSHHFPLLQVDRCSRPSCSVPIAIFQTYEVRSWCGVEYVRFRIEKYPPHVRDLKKYAWKPIVIAEQLNLFGTLFYVDSSVR